MINEIGQTTLTIWRNPKNYRNVERFIFKKDIRENKNVILGKISFHNLLIKERQVGVIDSMKLFKPNGVNLVKSVLLVDSENILSSFMPYWSKNVYN